MESFLDHKFGEAEEPLVSFRGGACRELDQEFVACGTWLAFADDENDWDR
jgi:hypothetical protein